jgi:hypothetical protein
LFAAELDINQLPAWGSSKRSPDKFWHLQRRAQGANGPPFDCHRWLTLQIPYFVIWGRFLCATTEIFLKQLFSSYFSSMYMETISVILATQSDHCTCVNSRIRSEGEKRTDFPHIHVIQEDVGSRGAHYEFLELWTFSIWHVMATACVVRV